MGTRDGRLGRRLRRCAGAGVLCAVFSLGWTAAVTSAGGAPTKESAVSSQPSHEGGPAQTPAGHEAPGEPAHGEGWAALVARLLNFGILVGALVYLLRRPFGVYLTRRGAAIRRDLADADALGRQAAERLAAIEDELRALPGAIDALRARAAEEIAAEEARIQAAADAERERLLALARREIDLRVRTARDALVREAAELAVSAAAERVRARLTPELHLRLVERYAAQVARLSRLGGHPGRGSATG